MRPEKGSVPPTDNGGRCVSGTLPAMRPPRSLQEEVRGRSFLPYVWAFPRGSAEFLDPRRSLGFPHPHHPSFCVEKILTQIATLSEVFLSGL